MGSGQSRKGLSFCASFSNSLKDILSSDGLEFTTIISIQPIFRCNHNLHLSFCPLPTAQCSLFLVTRSHHGLDVSANVKVAFKLDAQWIAGAHEIFKYHVDYVLVKDLHVAK